MQRDQNDTITAVPGIAVGNWTDPEAPTGCTVVLCDDSAVAAVDVRGGAPATRETDLLRAGNLVEKVHAVLLSGGSAFGLDAASGVMRWLEERNIGFPVATGVVPIVPAACLYDFTTTGGKIRPGPGQGHAACVAASRDAVVCGSVGAGAGATVGKALGAERCLRGGLGSAAEVTASGITVGAIVAVNCWGEVIEPDSGAIIAGVRDDNRGSYHSSVEVLRANPPLSPFASGNSTLAVVATDASFTRDQAYRVAVIAQTGLARTIRPVHTPVDGDIVFSLATSTNDAATDVMQIGSLAALALERAVINAVTSATSFGEIPSARDWA
jgi:L-aminopeptidase/D-esterase-like protein